MLRSAGGRAFALFFLQMLLSAVLLYLVFRQLSFQLVIEALLTIKAQNLIIALIAFIGSLLLTSYNWAYLLKHLGSSVIYRRALQATLAGLFYSFIIPSAFSSDATRSLRLYQTHQQPHELTMSIILDRLTGLVVFAVVLGIGILTHADQIPVEAATLRQQLPWLLGVVLLGSALLLVVAFLWKSLWLRQMQLLRQALRQWPMLLVVSLMTLLVHGLVALMLWCLCLPFWESPNLFYCLLVTEILTLAEFLPISVAGLGVRESVYLVMLTPMGLAQAEVLAVSLSQLMLFLAVALFGGFWEAWEWNHWRRGYLKRSLPLDSSR
jgi:hypothetical protein